MSYQFKISKEEFSKCLKFANDSVETSLNTYARRGQSNKVKITNDIRNGKLAELISFNYLKEKYNDITYPDFEIYHGKNKSWDPDLSIPNTKMRIAVKSQNEDAAIKYGRSWVFQKTDKGIFCDDDNDSTHFVSFVSLNVPLLTGTISAILSVQSLKENNMFQEMKLEYLRNNKVAVYFEELVKCKNLENLYQV